MGTYKTYERLTKKGCFSEQQGKTLTEVLSDLVTKKYLEDKLNSLRREIKADIKLEIRDVKISMYTTAIAMSGIIIAAIKLL